MLPSLDAHRFLRAWMQLCSWDAGWRSALLRQYEDKPCADAFTTAATADYFLCLVTAGSCQIESWRDGRWWASHHRVGSLAFRPPGATSTLRWTSNEPHQTLQLHLPALFFDDAMEELRGHRATRPSLSSQPALDAPLVATVMIALKEAMVSGAPDLYAESAAQFLAAHLLQRHGGAIFRSSPRGDDRRLRRADDFLRKSLAEPVSLAEIARVAGLSRFHLLRLFKSTYGETPFKRLTRFRMDEARRLLGRSSISITEIGFQCGYGDPANFAAAFRRHAGVSPTGFRATTQR